MLQVKGKINMLSIDKCKKTGVVFEELISSCEVVNATSVQVQATGHVATMAVEKTDGCQIYLPEKTAMVGTGHCLRQRLRACLLHAAPGCCSFLAGPLAGL